MLHYKNELRQSMTS